VTHLLDTDHISILQRRGSADYAVLVANLSNHQDADIGVSVVSLHEQALGCNALINNFRSPADVLLGYELLANDRGFPPLRGRSL
jgi:tRNA(fMet)-specific endonuclease VapC